MNVPPGNSRRASGDAAFRAALAQPFDAAPRVGVGNDSRMKVFLDACRMSGPLRLAVEAPGGQLPGVRTLHQPFALVGRDHRADVPLEDRLVSRRHAYLQVVDGHLFWFDLESRHGVEGAEGRGPHGWLAVDEAMRIGPYEIRRLIDDGSPRSGRRGATPPESTPLVAESYGSGPWPKAALEFLNGPSRSAVWPVNRVISLVGSAAGCKFRLSDASVAPFHCSLVRTSVGVWVVDLLGNGGVVVNNVVVRHAPLTDGDVLKVGRYRVRVRTRVGDSPARSVSFAPSLPEPPRRAFPALEGLGSPPLAGLPALTSGTAGDRPAPLELKPVVDVLAAGGEAGRISESVLVPLVNQFGIMQQQMLDQFQNAMGMLVEMFGSLQREQMDLIRRELDQLREVTREFQELKVELATLARDKDRSAAAPSEASAAPSTAPADPPEASAAPSAAKAAARPPKPRPAGDRRDAAAKRSEEQPSRRPTAERGDDEGDVMLWLNQRIATLQEERESRWRKILKLLPNAS